MYDKTECGTEKLINVSRPGWRSITEVLNLLPGAKVEEIQQLPIGLRKRRKYPLLVMFNLL